MSSVYLVGEDTHFIVATGSVGIEKVVPLRKYLIRGLVFALVFGGLGILAIVSSCGLLYSMLVRPQARHLVVCVLAVLLFFGGCIFVRLASAFLLRKFKSRLVRSADVVRFDQVLVHGCICSSKSCVASADLVHAKFEFYKRRGDVCYYGVFVKMAGSLHQLTPLSCDDAEEDLGSTKAAADRLAATLWESGVVCRIEYGEPWAGVIYGNN